MGTSFLDKWLEYAIHAKFEVKPNSSQYEELFRGYGPLSTFSAKIAIGNALGLLPPDALHDIKIIKSIRNSAAHRIDHVSFSDEEISEQCSKLILGKPLAQSDVAKLSELAEKKWRKIGADTPRGKFAFSFFRIVTSITANMMGHILTQSPLMGSTGQDWAKEIFKRAGYDYPSMLPLSASPDTVN